MAKHELTAVIFNRKGMVLSVGKNSYFKTHPLQARHTEQVGMPEKKFLHAEIAAIVKCKNLEKAHRIFVSRINQNGKPRIAKPCPVCISAIRAAGIKIIDHT